MLPRFSSNALRKSQIYQPIYGKSFQTFWFEKLNLNLLVCTPQWIEYTRMMVLQQVEDSLKANRYGIISNLFDSMKL